MQPAELRYLLGKYIDHTISKEEFYKLWQTLQEKDSDAEWHSVIDEVLTDKKLQSLSDSGQLETRLAQIKAIIRDKEDVDAMDVNSIPALTDVDQSARRKGFVVRFITNRAARYAAILVLLLSPLIYLLLRQPEPKAPATENIAASNNTKTIQPGTQKAQLRLSDGSVILLDSTTNGTIARQGNSQIVKLTDGQIRYQPDGKNASPGSITYNTMSTPRGGQYQLTLPDGSNIWLNAESSITYPVAFTGSERKVVITGEVYFEVAKDKSRPFRVSAGDQEIEVLGTHFNINAYNDEGHVKTSLLEGSVKVNRQVLKPGQAFIDGKIGPTDIDQDVAWKNGVFNFNNQSLAQVMRQLARWYNIEVVYPMGIPKKEYGGEIGRNLTLDQVLKGLENAGVRFQLQGRKLMVKL